MTENQNNWFALEITVNAQAAEAVEFALNELDAPGTEINNLGARQNETLCVIGYFNEKQDDKTVQKQLDEALRIYGFSQDEIKQIEWRKVENTDWLAEWKKHWKPTETAKFIIAPTWEKVENTDKIIIRIEPSMAFGTGTHETTKLCLRAIEENYENGESFFDVGTGTGILAIAAAKLKSEVLSLESKVKRNSTSDFRLQTPNFRLKTQDFISACDTDEDSIKIAIENAKFNGIDKINFYVGSISENTPKFDFVCANVTADIIIPMLPLLIEKTNKKLVLSGILVEQENLVAEKLRELRISNFKVQTDGEWVSVLVVNSKW
ncbi:MAG: 50S ribosomal protein L11 methyltransferase [Acidobacteria bacterium]|jgi:ribosomal protein L11 methyltransferase|nr:50S ribosomal protein L11 methyltransferase [Acidobacteriota bacterium]